MAIRPPDGANKYLFLTLHHLLKDLKLKSGKKIRKTSIISGEAFKLNTPRDKTNSLQLRTVYNWRTSTLALRTQNDLYVYLNFKALMS